MTNAGTLAEVLDLQAVLIRRGTLARIEHDVLEGHFCDDGTTHILCICGRGMWRPDADAESAYVQHVVFELSRALAVAA